MEATQLAREIAEEIGQKITWRLCKDEGEYNDAQSQITAIILRVLNGSDEYRRGVEDAAKIADERVEFWDKGKSNMFGILLITEAEQCAAAISCPPHHRARRQRKGRRWRRGYVGTHGSRVRSAPASPHG